jgi:tetratricopeptide (TPR) repeat protein
MSFFLILAPTSSFVPIADLAFEHRMYLPLACVLILVVFAVHQWTARLHLGSPQLWALRTGLLVIPVVLLGGRTMFRNRDYASELGMWQLVAQQRPENPRAYKNLAHLHKLAGRRDLALEYYAHALQLDPACYLTWIDYGNVFFFERDYDRAVNIYRQAIAKCPHEYQPWVSIAQVQARRGEMQEALDSCAEARSLLKKPLSRKERKVRAWILSTAEDPAIRNGPEALALLQSLPPVPGIPDLDLLDRFAAAYAETGDFKKAVELQQQVVRVAKSRKAPAAMQAEFAERLDLYQKNQPYRVHRLTSTGT